MTDIHNQAVFDEHVARNVDRWMGLAPTLGELNAKHLHKVVAFTVDWGRVGGLVEVTGILYDITHKAHGNNKPDVPLTAKTTVRIRTTFTEFKTYTLPSEYRCKMQTPYEESVSLEKA